MNLKQTARLAGFLYLGGGIVSTYGLLYAPYQTPVGENGFVVAQKIIANEFLFRTKIVSNLIAAIVFLLLVLVLYRLFKDVNEHAAKLLVAFMVVQFPLTFVFETFHITALMLLKGEILNSLEPAQAQNQAMLFLTLYHCGIGILEMCMGLWLLPFGLLVYRSGFIPRILGVFLITGGAAYIIDTLTFLLFPAYKANVSRYAVVFWALAEFPIILWLIIKGVRDQASQVESSSKTQ